MSRRGKTNEHTNYRDEGCDLHPACLTCPFEVCRYDLPGGVASLLRTGARTTATTATAAGSTPAAVALQLGISKRTAQRWNAAAGIYPPRPRPAQTRTATAERRRKAIAAAAAGETAKSIAAHMGITLTSVLRYLKTAPAAHAHYRAASIARRPPERPQTFERRAAIAAAVAAGQTTAMIAARLDIHRVTVNRYRRAAEAEG